MAGLAILGAGIFARDALKACPKSWTLKAVWSRSQKSAEELASKVDGSIDVYFDSPSASSKSLDDLLAREDIVGVVCCLPITNQPDIIRKALSAGKAVLSEKPIAKDVATASELVLWHGKLSKPPVWGVAENFRKVPSLTAAARKVEEVGGELVSFRIKVSNWVKTDNKYFNTAWRKTPEYQGGFLLDGGIHGIAGLRLLLASTGHDIEKVSCFSSLINANLPPVDSIYATATTDKGRNGVLSLSWATEHGGGWEIEIATTNGLVTWTGEGIKVIKGREVVENIDMPMSQGVKEELEAFAACIPSGVIDPKLSPLEGLKDIKVMQALLSSGDAHGKVLSCK